jgi:predicted DNA-binding transcriptional regulator YafY
MDEKPQPPKAARNDDPPLAMPQLDALLAQVLPDANLAVTGESSAPQAPDARPARLRILSAATRPINAQHWQHVAQAVLARRQLRILYHGRQRDETTERIVSPQRLVCYRGNWYLDTWCHLRNALRHFALDRLHPVAILEAAAHELSETELDAHFASAYGIFSGAPHATAELRFSPDAARWVADEVWHPEQRSQVLPDGSLLLQLPYSDARELLMDIMKYGPEVQVMAPQFLRDRVAQLAARTASLYRPTRRSSGKR